MEGYTPGHRHRSEAARLPEGVRDRVLKELDDDAAALYAHYRMRGLSEEESVRQVERWVDAAPGVWRELEEIHGPITVRWAGGLLEPGRRRTERIALMIAALTAAGAALPLSWGLLLRAPWGTGWLLLALAGSLPVLALLGARRLGVGPMSAAMLTHLLAIASVAAPAVALLGAVLALSEVGAGGDETAWTAVETAAGLLAAGLMVGVIGGLVWSAARAGGAREIRTGGGAS
jgi:hypothetical protein